MGLGKVWVTSSNGEKKFSFSHIKSTYYNYKNGILLSDKLDDTDKSISNIQSDISQLNSDLNKAMIYKGELTDSDDLNNVTDIGIYWTNTGAIPANSPYSNAFVLQVIRSSSSSTTRIVQIATRYGVTGHMSFRPITGSSWLDWTELATTDSFSNYLPLSGGTLTGNVIVSRSTAAGRFRASNNYCDISLEAAASGNRGLYDWTDSDDSKWTIYRNSSGNVVLGTTDTTTNIQGSTVYINGTSFPNCFTTQTFSQDNISINSSSTYDFTFSVSYSGYTPIAIAGYRIANASTNGAGCSMANVYICRLSGTTAYMSVRNTYSSTAVLCAYVYVLYVKS